jgi:hypothetical protein
MRAHAWIAAAVVAMASCAAAPSQTVGRDPWVDLATAQRTSPVGPGQGTGIGWTGADGKPVSVGVAAPQLGNHPTVITLAPGAGDNGPAIQQALVRLHSAGGGTLRLSPGDYAIASGPPAVLIDGATDVLIDGTGARLVFAQWGDGVLIRNSARLAIRGLSVGYARPAVLAATVKQGPGGAQLAFDPAYGALPPGLSAHQVTVYDRAAGSYKDGARRLLLGRDGAAFTPAASGRIALPGSGLDAFSDGDAVEVKLTYYKGGAIRIADPGDQPVSHDITLDGVTVRGSAGGGIVADLMGRGLAVLNSQIGLRNGPGGVVTIAYDAFHVTAMTGDILLRGNRFTGSGDDAMNLASPIFAVTDPEGSTATLVVKGGGVYPGAKIALFDGNLRLVQVAQVASRAARDPNGATRATFAGSPIADSVRYARNMDLLSTRYAVLGNDVSRCQCHGLLVQGPNGLVRGNSFESLRANAVRLTTSAWWKEGAGAQNVVVEKNRIQDTGADDRGGIVWAAIAVYAELGDDGGISQPQVATAPINARIAIRDNTISGVDQGCVSVASATDVTLRDNSCSDFNRRLNRQQFMVERNGVAAGIQRVPAKSAYLARGNGIWIDPLSTSHVPVATN